MSACVVLLIDESTAMDSDMARPMGIPAITAKKKKSESVATAVNSLLNKLVDGPDLDVAVVGYRGGSDGTSVVGCRWAGPLAGREFVSSSELAASPATVETRLKRIPGSGGVDQEEAVEFPIWYQPELGETSPQVAAFEFCHHLISGWNGDDVPLVINVSAGSSSDGNPQKAVEAVQEMTFGDREAIVLQAHLGSSDTVPATLYPANRAYLKNGPAKDLFGRASTLPETLIESLKDSRVSVNPRARGMIYNAKMIDLGRMLGLVQAHAAGPASIIPATTLEPPDPEPTPSESEPSPIPTDSGKGPTPEPHVTPTDPELIAFEPTIGSVTPESPALILLVLDRSLKDPYTTDPNNAFTKLRDHLNELVGQITLCGEGAVDVGIVSYGVDGMGESDIRTTLEGGLAGRQYARDNELLDGCVRDDSYNEEISNGVGGIIKVSRLQPVLVEVEPSPAGPTAPAFAEVVQVINAWRGEHPDGAMPPIVLHLTRGELEASDVETAAGHLRTSGFEVALYHLVVTQGEHPPVSYPDSESELSMSELETLWRITSPLLCRSRVALEDESITVDSRGIVVNSRFSLLLDPVKRTRDE